MHANDCRYRRIAQATIVCIDIEKATTTKSSSPNANTSLLAIQSRDHARTGDKPTCHHQQLQQDIQ
jgi:hypothetical protein